MNEKERLKKFLEEYTKICKKYGYCINACGCCNSPWIVSFDDCLTPNLEFIIGHLVDNPDLPFYRDIPLKKYKEVAKEILKEILNNAGENRKEITHDFDELDDHIRLLSEED